MSRGGPPQNRSGLCRSRAEKELTRLGDESAEVKGKSQGTSTIQSRTRSTITRRRIPRKARLKIQVAV